MLSATTRDMEKLHEQLLKRIRERKEIKSTKLHNAFRKIEGTKISDRTRTKALKDLEDQGYIKRKGHAKNTVCIYIPEEEREE